MNSEKEKLYYIRDRNLAPRVTVCLLESEDGQVTRGISLCSYLDIINKKEGRNKARGRATKAMYQKSSSGQIENSFDSKIILSDLVEIANDFEILNRFEYLSEFNPKLTTFEMKLLDKIEKEPK